MTLICSSTTGIRRAKLLCSRTSRVSSSSRVSVTACAFWLLISTPARVTPPVISATIISLNGFHPHTLSLLDFDPLVAISPAIIRQFKACRRDGGVSPVRTVIHHRDGTAILNAAKGFRSSRNADVLSVRCLDVLLHNAIPFRYVSAMLIGTIENDPAKTLGLYRVTFDLISCVQNSGHCRSQMGQTCRPSGMIAPQQMQVLFIRFSHNFRVIPSGQHAFLHSVLDHGLCP